MNLERLKDGSTLYGDCKSDPTEVPEWMDMERFKRGQRFFQQHSSAIVFALHCSLTVGFVFSNLLDPLVFTNRSDTPMKSLLRYLTTLVHLSIWHTDDVWDPNTLGHKSVQAVRRMHESVRSTMNKRFPSTNHISQYDMAVVQSGFMAVPVMYPAHFGIRTTVSELEDYIFFWRGIGYLLGIRDEYNVCAGMSYAETYALCKEIEDEVYQGLLNPPEKYDLMMNAYLDGTNLNLRGVPMYTLEAILAFSMEASGHDSQHIHNLSVGNKIRVAILKFFRFAIYWLPGVERFMNFLTMSLCRNSMNLVHKQLSDKMSVCPY